MQLVICLVPLRRVVTLHIQLGSAPYTNTLGHTNSRISEDTLLLLCVYLLGGGPDSVAPGIEHTAFFHFKKSGIKKKNRSAGKRRTFHESVRMTPGMRERAGWRASKKEKEKI